MGSFFQIKTGEGEAATHRREPAGEVSGTQVTNPIQVRILFLWRILRMRIFEKLFGQRETVFVIHQDKVLSDDNEKILKEEMHEYVKKSLRRLFGNKYIKYVDYFTNKKTLKTYTIMCTFDPKTYEKFLPLIYEIYAFTELNDGRLFVDYQPEYKEFSNEFQTFKVYKLKL